MHKTVNAALFKGPHRCLGGVKVGQGTPGKAVQGVLFAGGAPFNPDPHAGLLLMQRGRKAGDILFPDQQHLTDLQVGIRKADQGLPLRRD